MELLDVYTAISNRIYYVDNLTTKRYCAQGIIESVIEYPAYHYEIEPLLCDDVKRAVGDEIYSQINRFWELLNEYNPDLDDVEAYGDKLLESMREELLK